MLHKRYQLVGKDGQLIGYLVEETPIISAEAERFLLYVNVATVLVVGLYAFWIMYPEGLVYGLGAGFMGLALGLFVGEAAEKYLRLLIERW